MSESERERESESYFDLFKIKIVFDIFSLLSLIQLIKTCSEEYTSKTSRFVSELALTNIDITLYRKYEINTIKSQLKYKHGPESLRTTRV